MMNRPTFFTHIRREPFSGRMTQAQVDGVNALLDAWNDSLDVRWLAYILATAFHETGARMQPVREGFKTTDAQARAYVARQGYKYAEPDPVTGHVYYGRGHVQLTWAKNYKAMGEKLGLDLYHNPDLALDRTVSARILMVGMTNGLFTGKSLADYFNAKRDDPVGARRIVNGTDRAALIAGYHHAFLAAIRAAVAGAPEQEPLERETAAPWYPDDKKPLAKSKTLAAQGVTATGTAGAAVTEEVADTLTQAQDAAGQLAMYLDIAKWIFIALVIAGIGWTIYERVKAHREGRR